MSSRIGLGLLFIICLSSCDCHTHIEGKVISKTSKTPIEGVKIEMVGKNITTITDRNGIFSIGIHTGFCFDPNLRIESSNYKPFDITFPRCKKCISIELQSEAESFDYEKPFYPDPNNKGTFMTGAWSSKFSSNFDYTDDTLTFYMDTIDRKGEIEAIQNELRKAYSK